MCPWLEVSGVGDLHPVTFGQHPMHHMLLRLAGPEVRHGLELGGIQTVSVYLYALAIEKENLSVHDVSLVS